MLRELGKLRLPEDSPDQPAYVRDATPMKVKGEITTQALRTEFRRNPKLPILVGNDVFVKGVRQGVRNELYVYRSGDLLWGPGEPAVQIRIDEQSMVLTMAYAKDNGIWPRPSQRIRLHRLPCRRPPDPPSYRHHHRVRHPYSRPKAFCGRRCFSSGRRPERTRR